MALAVSGLLSMGALAAQDLKTPDQGEQFHVLDSRLLDVPGKPLSIKSTIEITKIKEGKSLTSHGSLIQARDSRGRIYRDYKLFQPENPSEPLLEQIEIFDATAGTRTFCGIQPKDKDKHCYLMAYTSPELSHRPYCASTPVHSDTTTWSHQEYQLGGVTVTRSRELCSRDGGDMTGGQEFWRNPELQLELHVYRLRRPFGQGAVDSRVTQVTHAEPDTRLFDVPDGFTVIDTRSGNPQK